MTTARSRLLSLLCLGMVVVLVWLFYWPRREPLKSRYVYYADPFERERGVFNPSCGNFFRRGNWEGVAPLSCLLARGAATAFRHSPSSALLAMHMTVVFASAIATFLLCRLYLSAPVALFVTVLLFCGRTLLPLTRGLGLTTVHLLIPLSLLLIYSLARIGAEAKGRMGGLAFVPVAAACLAVMYVLGAHETFYAAAAFAVGGLIVAARWLARGLARRRLRLGSSSARYLAALILGAVLGVGLMAAVRLGLPKNVHPLKLNDMLRYRQFWDGIVEDVRAEPLDPAPRWKVWRGTFVDGRYLTSYGSHHENTFLFPGAGFNGIVPLFVVPGLLIGLPLYVSRAWRDVRPRGDELPGRGRLFRLFVGVLLLLFAAAIALSGDPKPTRYTYSIFAVLVLSGWGYEWLYRRLAARLGRRARREAADEAKPLSRGTLAAALLVVLPLAALGALRLAKNYRDLQTYVAEYEQQIPTIALGPALDEALAEPPGRLVAVYCPIPRLIRHPSIGLRLRFTVPANVRLVDDPRRLSALPPGTKVLRPKTMPGEEYHYVPRRYWPGRSPDRR